MNYEAMNKVGTSMLHVYVLLVLSALTINTVVGQSFPCIKKDDICGCVFKNDKDESMLIPLFILDNKNGTSYYFSGYKGASSWYFYYLNLCTPVISTAEAGCKDVTGCQVSKYGVHPLVYTIANSGPESFGPYSSSKSELTVNYTKTVGKRQMFVHLIYKAGIKTKVDIDDTTPSIYTVTITTDLVKPQPYHPRSGKSSSGGLSTGSIIVIIFFVVLIIYFVTGIIFMKYKRGASGKEVIPNVDFWFSLPGFVKDGCVFFGGKMKELCQGCCQRDGYDEL